MGKLFQMLIAHLELPMIAKYIHVHKFDITSIQTNYMKYNFIGCQIDFR